MSQENNENYLTLTEALTARFYEWETRGRGWQIWDSTVELEPPFEPFYHFVPRRMVTDDGRKPTFLSSLRDKLTGAGNETRSESDYLDGLQSDMDSLPVAVPFDDDSPLAEITVTLQPEYKSDAEGAERFLNNLCYLNYPVSYELVGSADAIIVRFVCREDDLPQLRQQLHAHFPEAILREEKNSPDGLLNRNRPTVIIDFGLSEEFMRPLRAFGDFDPDPSIGTFAVMENLADGETGMVQILFQAVRHPWRDSIVRSVTDPDGDPFFLDAPEMTKLAHEKVKSELFAVVIRVVVQSYSDTRAWEIARSLASGLKAMGDPRSNELIPLDNEGYDGGDHHLDILARTTHRSGMLLNSGELISLVHLPSVSVRSQKLRRESRKSKTAHASCTGHEFILGENVHQGKRFQVSLNTEQRLRHVHVVGATGTGKSTLLLNMIEQDIERGNGLAVLDPHGDLVDRVLGLIPENRYEDVVLVDPADTDYPVGFNILEAHSEIERNMLASDMVGVFRRFSTSWGDQMTAVLGNAIGAIVESERGGTLLDLRRLLIEKEYRAIYLASVKDSEIHYFWEKEFPLLRGNSQNSILTRLDAFLRPKLVRNIMVQKKGLDFGNIVNGKKIFLAKLAQGLIGEENAYLLGTLFVSAIHQKAMARQSIPPSERNNFYLYIDEFQNFITPSMATVLSGSRKYHLGLTLSHQDLRQLFDQDTTVANSVISNAGTRICFRLGDFDAQKLKDGFSFFDSRDLQNLDIGEAIVRVERADNDFNLLVYPPQELAPELVQRKTEKIIALSRMKHSCPREEVEDTPYDRGTLQSILTEETKQVEEKPKSIVARSRQMPLHPPLEEEKLSEKREIIPEATTIQAKPVSSDEEKKQSKHRYLQTMIKKMAEDRGFRAIIEESVGDGAASGRVDVGLERSGEKIACEISVTTSGEHELQNIKKCLQAGYTKVLICCVEKKNLIAIRKLIEEKLSPADQEKVYLSEPEELYSFFEKQTIAEISREGEIKGYRVKVNYKTVSDVDEKQKRETIAGVIQQSLRRLKK